MTVYLLKAYRVTNFIKEKSVADSLGISVREYHYIEEGNWMPTNEQVVKLAALFKMSAGFIKRACRQMQMCQQWRNETSEQAVQIQNLTAMLRQAEKKK